MFVQAMILYSLICFVLLPEAVRAQCPHMMGQAAKQERAMKDGAGAAHSHGQPPLGESLEGVKARVIGEDDVDFSDIIDDKNAPGILPQETSIQTTFIHRSVTGEERSYAGLIAAKLRDIRVRLRKDLRLTVDNENIACVGVPSDHYRCGEYAGAAHSFHYLVVEDSSRGAAVYTIERDLNGGNAGKVEAALLDALSRHSPHQLTLYTSKEAEKQVGFIRELSTAELLSLQKPKKKERYLPRVSPLELSSFDPQMLEFRSSEGLEVEDHQLTVVPTDEVFTELLNRYTHVFVLFWTNVRSSSAHAFKEWAELSKIFPKTEKMQLAAVECHKADFCTGLHFKDFFTVVAYHNGVKVATQEQIFDRHAYARWVNLVVAGNLVELSTVDDVKNAKKGTVLNLEAESVTIGTFPSKDHISYKHFEKTGEKLLGRYFLAYQIKEGSDPSVVTYRKNEKKKRVDYSGHFDPASLTTFVIVSTMPAVVDISDGFSSDLLFFQPLPIIALVSAKESTSPAFTSLSTRADLAFNKYIFVTIDSDSPVWPTIAKVAKVDADGVPTILVFNKHKIHHINLSAETSVEKLLSQIEETSNTEPEVILTYNDVHPLQFLQLEATHRIYGKQDVALTPDLSLFSNRRMKAPELDAGGGCPFMKTGGGHGEENPHDEL